MVRVALVEDNPDLREGISAILGKGGFDVFSASCALDFYRLLSTERIDIAILDVGLPDQDGLSIARFLREHHAVGIVMLTARGDSEDKVRGFEHGADLYFTKPVDGAELIAAIGSLARRLGGDAAVAAAAPAAPAAASDHWQLDRTQWQLRAPDGAALTLTTTEFKLVDCMAAKAGEAVSRTELAEALGRRAYEFDDRSLDTAIRRLRQKAEGQLSQPLPIKTVHAVGYMFSAPIKAV